MGITGATRHSVSYYEQLIAKVDSAMQRHPHSTIAMASDTFEILASGKDPDKVARRMRARLKAGQVPMIFRRPRKGETWIL